MQMRALPCRAGRPPPAATTTGKRAVAVVCTHLPAPLPPVGCRGGPAEAGRRPGVACAVSLTDTPSSSPAAAAAVVQPGAPPATTTSAPPTSRPIAGGTAQLNQHIREGHYESALATLQARKADAGQASIASVLPPVDPSVTVDVTVVGAGPAGLFLAAELGRRGLSVNVLGESAGWAVDAHIGAAIGRYGCSPRLVDGCDMLWEMEMCGWVGKHAHARTHARTDVITTRCGVRHTMATRNSSVPLSVGSLYTSPPSLRHRRLNLTPTARLALG